MNNVPRMRVAYLVLVFAGLCVVALFAPDFPVSIANSIADTLRNPVSLALIIATLIASYSMKAANRRNLVLASGIGLAFLLGATFGADPRHCLVVLFHPITAALAVTTAFFWYSSRTNRGKAVLLLIGVVVGVAIGELCGLMFFNLNATRRSDRHLLAGIGTEGRNQRWVSVPYMLYAPAPDYRHEKNWHNAAGYRGAGVPIERSPHSIRILCLGGSTTYGAGTDSPEEAYPAVLRELLNADPPPKCRKVEVINGGLPNATTAELLTHYHFKFQYFSPDIVIVNTGGNDALIQNSNWTYYQPDYSHARQAFAPPQSLSPFGRTLLKSSIASLLIMPLFQPPTINSAAELPEGGPPPPIRWHPAATQAGLVSSLENDQLGFKRNLERLIQMVIADGGDVILVPFRVAPIATPSDEDFEQCDRNEMILKQLAASYNLRVAPFPEECITPGNWVDSCHLNAAGCREKAVHIETYVRSVWSARMKREKAED